MRPRRPAFKASHFSQKKSLTAFWKTFRISTCDDLEFLTETRQLILFTFLFPTLPNMLKYKNSSKIGVFNHNLTSLVPADGQNSRSWENSMLIFTFESLPEQNKRFIIISPNSAFYIKFCKYFIKDCLIIRNCKIRQKSKIRKIPNNLTNVRDGSLENVKFKRWVGR